MNLKHNLLKINWIFLESQIGIGTIYSARHAEGSFLFFKGAFFALHHLTLFPIWLPSAFLVKQLSKNIQNFSTDHLFFLLLPHFSPHFLQFFFFNFFVFFTKWTPPLVSINWRWIDPSVDIPKRLVETILQVKLCFRSSQRKVTVLDWVGGLLVETYPFITKVCLAENEKKWWYLMIRTVLTLLNSHCKEKCLKHIFKIWKCWNTW